MSVIQVVTALIRDFRGRFFLQRRGPTKAFAALWETPGGHVEPLESPVVALQRELQEELGVTSCDVCLRPLLVVAFDAPLMIPADVTVYSVTLGENQRPYPRETQMDMGFFWLRDFPEDDACVPSLRVLRPLLKMWPDHD